MVIRRDLLKTIGAVTAGAVTAVSNTANAQENNNEAGTGSSKFGESPEQAYGSGSNAIDIEPLADDFFIADRFKGKTVIVTGCARGMGRQATIRLAREGANVVGVDWIEDEGKEVIETLTSDGLKASFVFGDVAENDVCDEMVRVATEDYGGLDCALNNAGVMDAIFPGDQIDLDKQSELTWDRIDRATDQYWEAVMRVNVTGVFRCMRAELRQMLAQGRGGSIVNVGSVAGLRGFGGTPSYVASKHAVNGLTKNAAIDYAPFGIRVNSVNMANTDTPMVRRAMELVGQKIKESGGERGISLIKTQSLLQYADSNHRDSTAAEQVSVMLFLLSPESSNLTGATYATDGGFTTY